jgi:hypothetical protein
LQLPCPRPYALLGLCLAQTTLAPTATATATSEPTPPAATTHGPATVVQVVVSSFTPLPPAVVAKFQEVEVSSFLGLLPEISRCFVTFDNVLLLWNYDNPGDYTWCGPMTAWCQRGWWGVGMGAWRVNAAVCPPGPACQVFAAHPSLPPPFVPPSPHPWAHLWMQVPRPGPAHPRRVPGGARSRRI